MVAEPISSRRQRPRTEGISPAGAAAYTGQTSWTAGRKCGTSNGLLNGRCLLAVDRSAGTDDAWNIVYHGDFYNGIPGVYITPQGEFNPRQQSMLSPDLTWIFHRF